MAATVTHKGVLPIAGGNGKRQVLTHVAMNAAATAEVPAYLSRVDSWYVGEIANGGAADTLTMDEVSAVVDGSVVVPATGFLTFDLAATSTREFQITLIGV